MGKKTKTGRITTIVGIVARRVLALLCDSKAQVT